MQTIKTLDVTLRDGGNRINFHFTDEDLYQIITPLNQSGIEYIEIGYRNGAIRPSPNLGRAGMCDKDYLLQCRRMIHHAKVAVMAHPKNINIADLRELKACGVNLIRFCVVRGGAFDVCPLIAMANDEGFEVSVNFIHVSQYQDDELDRALAQVIKYAPDMIYFADSNGNLLPDEVTNLYERYTKLYEQPLGFHAHDNLGLAQMNTLNAIGAGASYVDFSLSGMGKGIGNLRTEYFLAYLAAIGVEKYNLEVLLPATNYVRREFETISMAIEMDEFTRGIFDLSTAQIQALNKVQSVDNSHPTVF
jgi:4-hydroxy 2-oxovalerate aldolase